MPIKLLQRFGGKFYISLTTYKRNTGAEMGLSWYKAESLEQNPDTLGF